MTFAWLSLGATLAIMLASPAVLLALGLRGRYARWAARRRLLIQHRLERVDEDAAWSAWMKEPPLAIVTKADIVFAVNADPLLEAFMDAEARVLRALSLQRRPELVR